MRTRILFLALGLGLVGLLPSSAADAERIAKLIADLGSAKFEDRAKANRELEAIGRPALEALRKAVKTGDLETQRRAEELVRKLESQLQNESLLVATRLRLTYKDTPILEAIADIAKKTGFNITYIDDADHLKGRTLTLDTGETTFWQAFDQFCQKAGLVEGSPQHTTSFGPQRELAAVGGAIPVQPAAAKRAALPLTTIVPSYTAYRHIMLLNAKPTPLATDYANAVRVRALTPETELLNAPPRAEREVRVLVEVAPEPKVELRRMLGLRLEKALDDRGQTLKTLNVADANPLPRPVAANTLGTTTPAIPRQVAVRLEAAEQPSRTLKELAGIVTMLVRTPPKVMATVDDLLKATGKTVKGEAGVSLTVREVTKQDDGQVQLVVLLERPSDVFGYFTPSQAAGGVGAAAIGGQIQIQALPLRNIKVAPVPLQPAPGVQPPAPAQPAAQLVPPGKVDKVPNEAAPADQAAPPVPQAVPPGAVPPNPGQPPNAVPPGPPQPKAQVLPVQVPAAGQVREMTHQSYVGLSVVDAKGLPLPLVNPRNQGQRTVMGVVTQEVALTVKPRADQGEPVKLLFTGTRDTTVEATFTLKDVPLAR